MNNFTLAGGLSMRVLFDTVEVFTINTVISLIPCSPKFSNQ